MPAPDDYAAATRAYAAGQLQQAETLLTRLVAQQPRHAGALHVLGLIAQRTGRAELAELRLRAAAALEPGNHLFHANLAIVLQALGRVDAAIAALRQALTLKPDYVAGLVNLGVMFVGRGEAADAADCFRRALGLEPRNAAAAFGLGNALALAGQPEPAAAQFRVAIELKPDFVEAHNNLGNALAEAGDMAGALRALERACRLRPNDHRLWLNFGRKQEMAGQGHAAIAALDRARSLAPGNAELLSDRLRLAWAEGDEAGAAALLDELVKVAPERARTHAELAVFLEGRHQLDAARAAAERALALDSGESGAVLVLARLDRRAGNLAAARVRLEAALGRRDDSHLAHELGQVLDLLDEPAAAFAAIRRGKRLLAGERAAQRARPAAYLEMIETMRRTIETAPAERWAALSVDGPAPAFFVAFPRSGTTLMEQMLAGHPALRTAEERPFLVSLRAPIARLDPARRGYPEGLAGLPDAAIAGLRRSYWAAVAQQAGAGDDGRRLIDKLPLNIVHLGLVARVFPDAPVLVALRDPRDVVLSCFMQSFEANDAMASFADLAGAARLYAAVMGLWRLYRERLALRCHVYRYEDLIGEPRATLGGVVGFLGLPWDDALLQHATRAGERLVKTPSYAAVARPLNDRAIGRWRRYREQLRDIEPLLAPFVEAFGYGDE